MTYAQAKTLHANDGGLDWASVGLVGSFCGFSHISSRPLGMAMSIGQSAWVRMKDPTIESTGNFAETFVVLRG